MRSLAVGIVMSSLLVGCGEIPPAVTDGGVDAPSGDVCGNPQLSVDEFFTCLSRTFCDVLADCTGADVAHLDCDNLPLSLLDNNLPPAVKRLLANSSAAGRAQWSPPKAAECIANVRALQCQLFAKEVDDDELGCDAVIGNVLDGAPCQADFECATPGSRCQSPSGGPPGCGNEVCRKPAALGQSCADVGCGPGNHCVRRFSGTDMSTCESGAAGAVCDRSGECDQGLFCNGGTGNQTAAGICTAAKPAGAICLEDLECQGELMCVGESGTNTGFCSDVRAVGAQCDDLTCFGHQLCVGPQSQLGTCSPAVSAGAACATSNGVSWCGFALACDASVCAVAGALGDTCTARGRSGILSTDPNGCAGTLFCSTDIVGGATGTCEAPRADGQSCMQNDHCVSAFCDPNRTCAPIPVCF